MATTESTQSGGVAFLLAQLGAHASARFAQRMADLGYTAPQAGVLRILRSSPGLSQQELAVRLGMQPSRVVAFVDELESAGLVERVRDDTDRRRNAVVLTAQGKHALTVIGRAAKAHEEELTSALSSRERDQLRGLLERLGADQGLAVGVHPGYRTLGRSSAAE